MSVNVFPILRGLASYVLPKSMFRRPGSGGTYLGSYCYSTWLRHLHYLIKYDLFDSPAQIRSIAEIGPGDSFGIGMAGIYTGANRYYAMDAIAHANVDGNIRINDDLCALFLKRSPVTGTAAMHPVLESNEFPSFLDYSNDFYIDRHEKIQMVLQGKTDDISMRYIVPWIPESKIDLEDIDLVLSQAVMEHVSDLEFAYSSMYKILRKGGVISHQIDFKAHETSDLWNGHFYINYALWSIMEHGRKYPINRYPLSSHIESMQRQGFKIVCVIPVIMPNTFKNKKPNISGVSFTEDDLVTASAHILATK